jgi:hypothetical protein
MKILLTLLILFNMSGICYSQESIIGTVYAKAKAPSSWIGRKATKYGFIFTVMATNSLRMAKEADNFDSRNLLGNNTYHTINALEVVGWIASGIMLYTVIERDDWTFKDKTKLIAGTLLLTRESGEFTYQGLRHGNPFNNNPDFHQNEIAWFTGKHGFPYLQDKMISTGTISTPALHIGMTGIGTYLIGGVK